MGFRLCPILFWKRLIEKIS